MQAGSAAKIEANIDRTASGLFGVAAACSSWMVLGQQLVQPQRGAIAGGIAAVCYLACRRTLASIRPQARKLPVPVFNVRDMDPIEPDELLLTERFEPPSAVAEEPLILDDILDEIDVDSRVVRLFDAAAMPTPGQLNDRIRQHLVRGPPPAPPQDASQALYDALAELRRSLG